MSIRKDLSTVQPRTGLTQLNEEAVAEASKATYRVYVYIQCTDIYLSVVTQMRSRF